MVLELVERRLAARLNERAVERFARLEREPRFEIATVIFRNRVETGQLTRSTRMGSPSSMSIFRRTDFWSSLSARRRI